MTEYLSQLKDTKKKKKKKIMVDLTSRFEPKNSDNSTSTINEKRIKKVKKESDQTDEKISESHNNLNTLAPKKHRKKIRKIQPNTKVSSPAKNPQSPFKSVVTPRRHHKDHRKKKINLEDMQHNQQKNKPDEYKTSSQSELYYENSLTEESRMESLNSLSRDRLSLFLSASIRSPTEALNNVTNTIVPNNNNPTTNGVRNRPMSLIRTTSEHSTKFSWGSDNSEVSLFSPAAKKELETKFALMEEIWHDEGVNNVDADRSIVNVPEFVALNSIPEDFDLDDDKVMEEQKNFISNTSIYQEEKCL